MKIYIVNLPRFQERRDNILRECARFELRAEIFPGVDGNDITDAEFRKLIFEPDLNPIRKSVACCTLHHLDIYRDMIKKDLPLALILEDDSVFSLDPRPLLDALEQRPPDAPEVYLLTHRSNCYIASGKPRRIGAFRFYRGWNGVGSHGYVITRSAAVNICGFQAPIRCVCDWWKYFQLYDLIRFYVCEKEIIGLHAELGHSAASNLENDRFERDKVKKYLRHLRKQMPFRLKIRYFFRKLRYWHALRHQ